MKATPLPILHSPLSTRVEVQVHSGRELEARLPALTQFVKSGHWTSLSRHPAWLTILADSFRNTPYALEATIGGRTVGFLGLSFLKSVCFGRFLVSLPYLNYGGVLTDDASVQSALIDRAARLADTLNVRYLELRHEWAIEHDELGERRVDKVHMRLDLPTTVGKLWDQLSPKVRNQVRKGQKGGFTVSWGGAESVAKFYAVFSRNMRDLGTPVFPRRLFENIVRRFPNQAEFCVVQDGGRPVAGAMLLHGTGVTEVPSASSLKSYNSKCVNMVMYWHLLERAIARGQDMFDFGRSSEESPTYRFKKQWGATACPAEWQYYARRGSVSELRPDNPKYQRLARVWQRLPLWVTRRLGPRIVRGIP